MYKLAIIIPFYNHANSLAKVLPKIVEYNFPIFVINDGSNLQDSQQIEQLCQQLNVFYQHNKVNRGKGAVVVDGFNLAIKHGFTHALQIDADGQHNLEDIDIFVAQSKANLTSIINGCPIYGDDVPKARYYARKITDFWVAVETLSLKIEDSMCGFRIYPLDKIKPVCDKLKFYRMGFDIEIIVKSFWAGINIINYKTKVIYPIDNTSNFRVVKDNLLISLMHTYLCCLLPLHLFKRILLKRN